MKASSAVLAFLSSALAAPIAFPAHSPPGLCNGGLLYSVPSCCSASVLDVASLDCVSPVRQPLAMGSFRGMCGPVKSPKCCSIPLAGLGILCTDAIGA